MYLHSTDAAAEMAHNPVATNRANSENTPLIASYDSGSPRSARSATGGDAEHILDDDDEDLDEEDKEGNSTGKR